MLGKKTPERDLAKAEKIFTKSLQEVEELYIFLLLYLIEVKDYAANLIEESKNKKLLTEEDVNPNTKFIDNQFLNSLKDDTPLLALAGEFKLSFSAEKEMIKNIYFNLKKTEEFQEYMHSSEEGFDFDKKFITKIFSKFFEDEHFSAFVS